MCANQWLWYGFVSWGISEGGNACIECVVLVLMWVVSTMARDTVAVNVSPLLASASSLVCARPAIHESRAFGILVSRASRGVRIFVRLKVQIDPRVG